MSENADKDSKTEEATEKKIQDSLDKGQVPVAKEISSVASFLAILTFFMFFVQDSVLELGAFLSIFLERPDEWSLATQPDAVNLYRLVIMEIAKVLVALLVLMMLAGIVASVIQNMPRMVLDRIQPKLSRISIKQGWGRLFGQQGWVEFGKSLGKIFIVGGFVVFAMREAQTRLLDGMLTPPDVFAGTIRQIAIEIVVTIVVIMVVVAAADLLWSRFHWRQELRMTRQEVKDELKQTDGDPIVKSRLRSMQRDRARQRMITAVPSATLVIANPTHFAIALRYAREEMAAPVVVAKGQDLIALKIREIAEENGVPVFENVDLARSMYKQVSVDKVIPPEFYQAVAELVRIVYGAKAQPSAGRPK
ncbi:MAG: flagellar biosynthesis protein FlhB [Aliihoeflea sp.]|uniref:flagellar biosynthesis protein FlhB n=1 Tax=Aliihoeflea sp. 40Bstr573 TaxID=2696467 RepID=UPI0020948AA2|nr:flagellar biosynthesis protein FlhB [Aliihoeflea sp. 40Bstr573]MCO6386620.1 flagellar biosynthesis protein FlhB [Aliihoeflea sp. 40Bstr573]